MPSTRPAAARGTISNFLSKMESRIVRKAPKERRYNEGMKTIHRTLSALTLLTLSGISLAQAPIERQAPPPPPPDQQQQAPFQQQAQPYPQNPPAYSQQDPYQQQPGAPDQ